MEIKINLIPPYKKEEIIQARRLSMVAKLELATAVIVIVFLFFLVSLKYILEINYKMVSSDTFTSSDSRERYEKIKGLEEEFKEVNTEIASVLEIKESQLYWSNLYSKLNNIVFSGIDIQAISTKDYEVYLVGKSDNRDSLMKFKEELEKEECFLEVNLPFSNLVAKDNIDFQIDFKIKPECVQKK